MDNYKSMFESRISSGAVEKLPEAKAPGKLETNTISSWSHDMEGYAIANLRINRINNWYEVATPAIDDHHFLRRRKWICWRIASLFCSQIVLTCLHSARIGRTDILWSVNNLARAVTKLTKACDKRLARFISYIHHTCECQTILSCGKHCTTMQTGIVSRF